MGQHEDGIALPGLPDHLKSKKCFHSFLNFHQLSSYSESALSPSEHLFPGRYFVFEFTCLLRTLVPYLGEFDLMQTVSYREGKTDPHSSPRTPMLLAPRAYQTLVHRLFYMGSIQVDQFQYIPLFHCLIAMTPCISDSLHWLKEF